MGAFKTKEDPQPLAHVRCPCLGLIAKCVLLLSVCQLPSISFRGYCIYVILCTVSSSQPSFKRWLLSVSFLGVGVQYLLACSASGHHRRQPPFQQRSDDIEQLVTAFHVFT